MKHILLLSILTFFTFQPSLVAQNKNAVHSDGLLRSTPEVEGVHSDGILRFIESIEKSNMELHSFMLLRHGRVVAEGWWNPYLPDMRHIMYSVSKTYTSTAVGFAIAEKRLSLDDKVVSFFPEYNVYPENSFVKNLIVRNLLTMSAGEEPFTDFRLRDADWVKAFLCADQNPLKANKFTYNSYAAYMMSAILQRVTGSTLLDYLQPRLFDPLQMKDIASEQSPAGIVCGGWGMSIRTADMAKLGQLYLQKGKWNGKQLLPAGWIEEATKVQIENGTGLTDAEKAKSDWAQGYGYYVWHCRHNAYRADGSYGQYIIVMPDQDAVLAVTANVNDMQKELQQVWDSILPAIANKKLPENNNAYNALTQKLKTLELPSPFKVKAEIKKDNFSKIYAMESNDSGIRNIALKQKDDLCYLTIRTNSATHNFVCGNNKWEYSETDKNSPYYNAGYRNPIGLSPFAVAGCYTWEDSGNMCLKLIYTEDSSNESYHITFDGKRIIVLVTNSEAPESLPIRLVGYSE
ncbi:serine hydrolase [uncultured Bacteroides sp.]|uniref:serine hydrolase domain-containing protein n=1 Tax=uncultured Bacteroides sp. TaxID=162156 RepID=UPI002AABC081|nr:serine hydrolase [uncultured Bacteroides sp.]